MPVSFRIAVLAGDGIGPETIAEAVKALRAAGRRLNGVAFDLLDLPAGAAHYLRTGDPLPPATLEAAAQADAILLGAMGLPEVRLPNGTEIAPQLDLREKLDLYLGLRPVILYHGRDTPLAGRSGGAVDLLIVRENTEGLFFGRHASRRNGSREVRDVMRISRAASERLFRGAFEQARRRRGHLTLVDKANVLPSMAFFRRVFDEIAREYPGIRTQRLYVDAASLRLVQNPGGFDVIVTENMFGDILSDLAAGLVGGMGMAPSADLGERHGVFQPAHGSAPDIAGKGVANPTAAILSAAMMLEWLGHPETLRGAAMIRGAVRQVYTTSLDRTPDLGGSLTTAKMGDKIADWIG
jgi:3-isopropylmalate dehydrogenase